MSPEPGSVTWGPGPTPLSLPPPVSDGGKTWGCGGSEGEAAAHRGPTGWGPQGVTGPGPPGRASSRGPRGRAPQRRSGWPPRRSPLLPLRKHICCDQCVGPSYPNSAGPGLGKLQGGEHGAHPRAWGPPGLPQLPSVLLCCVSICSLPPGACVCLSVCLCLRDRQTSDRSLHLKVVYSSKHLDLAPFTGQR